MESNQIKQLEFNSIITEMKIPIEMLNSRLDICGERKTGR